MGNKTSNFNLSKSKIPLLGMIYFVLKKRGEKSSTMYKTPKINAEAEGSVWRSDLGIPPSPEQEETFHLGEYLRGRANKFLQLLKEQHSEVRTP